MKHLCFILILLCLFVPLSGAQQLNDQNLKTFRLSDGTILNGYLIHIESDGAYLIDSTKLGVISVPAHEVISMTQNIPAGALDHRQTTGQTNPLPAVTELPGNVSTAMKEAQNIMLSDPAIYQDIQKLMADPEVLQLLQDPQLLQRLMAMDPQSAQSDPVIQRLLQNPQMQAIIQRTGQKMTGQNEFSNPHGSNP